MIGAHVVITSPTFYGAFGVVTGQWPTGQGRAWAPTRYEVLMPGYGTVTLRDWEFMSLTEEMEAGMEFPAPQLCLDRMHIDLYERCAVKDFEAGWHDRAEGNLRVAEKMRAKINERLRETAYEWEIDEQAA